MATPAADQPAPPAPAAPRARWRAVQMLLAAVVLVAAGMALWRQWQAVPATGLHTQLRPGPLALASLIVLGTYALLIETWRRTLASWGAPIPFAEASRVWNVSNLGKYVPGKVWQITAMTVMLQRLGVPLATSGAAAVVVTLANVVVGFLIVLLLGASTLDVVPGGVRIAALLIAVGGASLLAAPAVVPRLARMVGRLSGRPVPPMAVPARAVWWSVAGCAVAWLLYGLAFRLFVAGVLGSASGPTLSYVVAYTGSYLLGYLAIFVPGGLGVRELALTATLPALGLATAPEAVLVSVASRLWLTVLELLPGVAYLVAGSRRAR